MINLLSTIRADRLKVIIGICVLILVMRSGDAFADDVKWNGFFSAGVAASDSDVVYQSAVNKTPNWGILSRAGLNASTSVTDELAAVFQVVADAGSGSMLRPTYILLNYRPFESLSLRLGRQQLPLWLLSDFLYVGHAIPWTFAPDEVYGFNPLDTLDGVNATYSFDLGSIQLVTEVYGGSSSRKRSDKKNLEVKAKELKGVNLSVSNDFFTLRSGYTQADVSVKSEAFTIPEFTSNYISYGLKVDYKGFMFLGEHAALDEKRNSSEEGDATGAYVAAKARVQQTGAFEDKIAYQKAEAALGVAKKTIAIATGWYSLVGYRIGAWVPNFTYAAWRPKEDNLFNSPQKSQTLGLRYDLNPNTAFKISMKRTTIKDTESGFFDPAGLSAARNRPKNVNIFSSSVDVVF